MIDFERSIRMHLENGKYYKQHGFITNVMQCSYAD